MFINIISYAVFAIIKANYFLDSLQIAHSACNKLIMAIFIQYSFEFSVHVLYKVDHHYQSGERTKFEFDICKSALIIICIRGRGVECETSNVWLKKIVLCG